MICEQLHPTGIDDPLGLEAVLRTQSERVLWSWPGACSVEVDHEPVRLSAPVQLAAMRIVREALSNAAKHARATQIRVTLRYPACAGEPVTVAVRDDGAGRAQIVPRPGHWGVRNMGENARMAGGTLEIQSAPGSGTLVTFQFATEPPRVAVDAPEQVLP